MKCPYCGQYSLVFDLMRNGWVCQVYNGFIPDEHMPQPGLSGWHYLGFVDSLVRLANAGVQAAAEFQRAFT